MAKSRITKRAVDAAKPNERDTYLWDADLAGFGLKVTPAGSKVYLVQFRLGGRRCRTRRVTIGRHGSPWTPDSARKEAKRLLGEVGSGRDPAEERTRSRRDLTIAELCDLYLAEGCSAKKPSTLATDRGRIERHIIPLLGRRKVTSVSRQDVRRFMHEVASGQTAADIKTGVRGRAIIKGGKGTATRTTGLLGGIFTFAMEKGLRADNPVRGVKRFRDKKHERFLSPSEMAQLGDTLSVAQKGTESQIAIAAIRLLILTGARKSEILTLKWDYVDMDRGCLRLPDSKTGAKVVPLGAAALAVLSEIPRIDGNPYVLPGLEGRHFVGLQKAWERIRKRAGLNNVRLHDLRHSFASVAVAGGDSLYLVGKVLGHQQASTTERYAHIADDPLKAVADKTSAQIAAAMKNGNGGADVVELKRPPPRKA